MPVQFSKLFLSFAFLFLFLLFSPTSASGPITTTLRLGMKDIQVLYLQQSLNERNFIVSFTGAGSQGQETTYFGPAILSAVKKYQTSYGLVPDGIFGAKSRGALGATPADSSSSQTYSPGCTSVTLYSALTGQPCFSSSTNFPSVCVSNLDFSQTTGLRCDSTFFVKKT